MFIQVQNVVTAKTPPMSTCRSSGLTGKEAKSGNRWWPVWGVRRLCWLRVNWMGCCGAWLSIVKNCGWWKRFALPGWPPARPNSGDRPWCLDVCGRSKVFLSCCNVCLRTANLLFRWNGRLLPWLCSACASPAPTWRVPSGSRRWKLLGSRTWPGSIFTGPRLFWPECGRNWKASSFIGT
jgi:hypothetical protein